VKAQHGWSLTGILVYQEPLATESEAVTGELQLKGRSRAKKEPSLREIARPLNSQSNVEFNDQKLHAGIEVIAKMISG
jgi:hypothetical protein